jgi:ABC-type transporter Mla subunit MlaD
MPKIIKPTEGKMDRPTVTFHIDSETLNGLSHANDELIQSLHWLLGRRDLAAFEKLYPIVRQITELIVAILEGAFPEMSHVSDALNRLSDAINERMSQARTQEEIEQLSREVEALVSDHQELVDEVTTEVVRLEKQGRKQDSIRMAANIRNS